MVSMFSDPLEFWGRIQKTIERAGKTDESVAAAIKEIDEEWLARTDNPWQEAIRNCEDDKLPDPWKDRRPDLEEVAKRFTCVVLESLPKALRQYRNAKQRTVENPDRTARQLEIDQGAQMLVADRDVRWRFFGDPQVHDRGVLQFPVATVFNHGTKNPKGYVVQMTIEILEPGLGDVVPHPVLELSGLQADQHFTEAAGLALRSASRISGMGEHPSVTAGFFSPQFLAHGIELLKGKSAGGAFALAFETALNRVAVDECTVYDQRVIIIATILDEEGSLGPVENIGAGENEAGPTFLECKAEGIIAHNRNLKWDEPTYIDTVGVVAGQKHDMEKALRKAMATPWRNPGATTEHIRVVAIEDVPSRMSKQASVRSQWAD